MRLTYPKSALVLTTALFLLLLGSSGCKENPVDASGDVAARSQTGSALDGEDLDEIAGAKIPFADAEVFFEFNTTDNDLGLQISLDAEGWKKVKVSGPSKAKIFEIKAQGELAELGITELRFESAEPSPAEVLAKFPPGEYKFKGDTVEGGKLESIRTLSHDFVPAFSFSPSDGEEVDPDDAIVEWDAPGAELVEIIIESDDSDAVFDVIVEGDEGDLDIPSQFLEPNTEYKIELLAISENGNKTIVESTFVTGGDDDDD